MIDNSYQFSDPRSLFDSVSQARQDRDAELDGHADRHGDLILAGQIALIRAAIDNGGCCTADDFGSLIEVPDGVSRRVIGAVPRGLAAAGLIEKSGYQTSTRVSRRCTPTTVWCLVDLADAKSWLSRQTKNPSATLAPPDGSNPKTSTTNEDSSNEEAQ